MAQGQHSTLRRSGTAPEQPAGWSKSSSNAAAASEEAKAYSVRHVEPPSAARTKLADFFNILLRIRLRSSAQFDSWSRKLIFLSETSSLRPFLALGALALLLALEWWIPFRGLVQSKLRHVTTNLTIAGTNAVVVHLLLGGPLLLWSQVVKTEGWGLLHQLGMGPI